jgi:hypothetical protein
MRHLRGGRSRATLSRPRAPAPRPKLPSAVILATDGVDFQAEELAAGETVACQYADFPNHFGLFLPLKRPGFPEAPICEKELS